MIFSIIGKSCSGKDTIFKRLSNHPSLNRVVTMTTRSIRSNEKQGVDYHFVTDEEFLKLKENDGFVESTQFNGWYYGTPKDSIDTNKHHVIVINPQGLLSLVDTYGWDNVVALVIDRPDRDRAISYLLRDNDASVDEMYRRFNADEEDFKVINELNNDNVYHIHNETGNFGKCISQIEKIIGGYLK